MARRAKGEGSLLKLKHCRWWYCQFYDRNGRQQRVSSHTEVKQEALGVLRRLMADRDRGLAPITDLRKLHYGDLRQALIDNYVERGNKTLEIRTDGSETIKGLAQLDAFYGFSKDNPGTAVAQITTNTAREFVRQRQAEGVGNATINRSLACLRRMLRIAHEDGRLQNVPVIRLLKEPPARKGFLPLDKFQELAALLPGQLRPLIYFLYFCGCRLGEALQIEWPQVDLGARLIRLEGEQTKNAEPRMIPLPSELVMLLSEIEPKVGRVFCSQNLRTEWEKACAACGLGTLETVKKTRWAYHRYSGLIIHDLRRSAVRNLVNAGVPELVAMRISGHKTRSVFDRYHIVSTDDVSAAMRRLETAAASDGAISVTSVKHGSRRSGGLQLTD